MGKQFGTVRLPVAVVEALALKEGDDIEIHVVGERAFELEKKPSSEALLMQLRKFSGCLPADFKFDRPAFLDQRICNFLSLS